MTVYLDHNATTPAAREVTTAVADAMRAGLGNAASQHSLGRAAAARVSAAREHVAKSLEVQPNRLTWTSGATESLNTALRAVASKVDRVLLTGAEHKAVLDVVQRLEADGAIEVAWLRLIPTGELQVWDVESAAEGASFALVVTAANNETGVMADVARLTSTAHGLGGVVVCDATQMLGKLPVNLGEWGVDFAAFSAHKAYGPAGVGALVVPHGWEPEPLIHGGGHQRGWRSGTLNLAGIVGFEVACALIKDHLDDQIHKTEELRDLLLEQLVQALGPLPVNGGSAKRRLPNTLNVRIPGVQADALIANCPDVAFSTGSACTSAVPTPSHVLTAMGLSAEHAEESIRLSLGRGTTVVDIDLAAKSLIEGARRIRSLTGIN